MAYTQRQVIDVCCDGERHNNGPAKYMQFFGVREHEIKKHAALVGWKFIEPSGCYCPECAPQAPVQPQAVVPPGFALVPLRMTRAMQEVFADEWDWPAVLAAAEAITEDEQQALAAMGDFAEKYFADDTEAAQAPVVQATSEPLQRWTLRRPKDAADYMAKDSDGQWVKYDDFKTDRASSGATTQAVRMLTREELNDVALSDQVGWEPGEYIEAVQRKFCAVNAGRTIPASGEIGSV